VKDAFPNRPTNLADYLAILGRRKWIILALPLIAAASAFLVSQTQKPLYSAGAQILVNNSNIVSTITNVYSVVGDPNRFLTTQASVARSPELAKRVVAVAHVRGATTGSFLHASSVAPEANADILDVTVSWSSADGATRLANAYASQFTRYTTELETNTVNQALARLRLRLQQLQARGAVASASYGTLLQQQSQLETVGTLLANNTSVLQPATGAGKVQPRPSHNAVFGGLLGLVLGVALAFMADALDRRVRSEEEIEEILGLPLLGRVPRPPKSLREANGLALLADPAGSQAESFRKLKTSLDFLNVDRRAKTIMVTSAVPREGKSTTIANLAVAFARSGRSVALVDLDLRRPSLHSFFYTGLSRGVFDVVRGEENIADALRRVSFPAAAARANVAKPSKNGSRPRAAVRKPDEDVERSVLSLLPAGAVPPAATDSLADFLESDRLSSVLDDLASQFDVVLIDTPPLLSVGDAMVLTSRVDALFLVLHAGSQRPLLHELARQLRSSRVPVLGFVLTGVSDGDAYGGYGYGYEYEAYTRDAPATAERAAPRV
jgi:Mrp family chromosome partitioning ATPase/capsular polysaccharide biosynthesis protein